MADVERLRKLAEDAQIRYKQALAREKEAERKRRDRQMILTGVAVWAEAEQDAEFKERIEAILRQRVEERNQYCFPDLFPGAKPPQGRKKQVPTAEA